MAKPDYAFLFSQIAIETDPLVKEQLIQQTLVFTEELTDTEKNFFNYVSKDYIENNPSELYVADLFPEVESYVGTYYFEGVVE